MKLLRSLRALFRKGTLDREMSEEMRHHLEMQIEENLASGLNLDEARSAAQRSFGGLEQIKEQARDQRRWLWLEHLGQDLRTSARMLRKYPAFTAITILTLALGIGANTAIFTVVDAALLRPLAVNRPEELVVLTRVTPEQTTDLSYPMYRHLRDHAASINGLAAANPGLRLVDKNGATATDAPAVRTSEVSGNYFPLLGVQPALGRLLVPADDREGAPQAVAVISHRFWQTRFGSDPDIVGQEIVVDHVSCTIVGVAPAGFSGLSATEPVAFWLPIQLCPRLDAVPPEARLMHEVITYTSVIGRLAPGVTRAQAEAECAALFQARQDEVAATSFKSWSAAVRQRTFNATLHLRSGLAGNNVHAVDTFGPLVSVLWIVVALVLLLACANVASLIFVRGSARRRELGVRSALGASRGRLAGQLLVEALLLAGIGGGIGVLAGPAAASFLVAQTQDNAVLGYSLDLRILGFSALVTLMTGLAVGLAPAVRLSRPDLFTVLKDESGGTAGASRLWFNRILTVAQVAISLCLLTGAGLFVRTLQNLYALDPGFERRNTVLFSVWPEKTFARTRRPELYREIWQRIADLPGVQSATFSMGGMGRGMAKFAIAVGGYVPMAGEDTDAYFTMTGPDYFKTLGTPIVQGREYDARGPGPANAAPIEVVINEFMARKYFGAGNPIGREFKFAGRSMLVVGICHDAKYQSLRDAPTCQVYMAIFHSPLMMAGPLSSMYYQARTTGEASVVTAQVRSLVRQIAPQAQVANLTMDGVIDQSLSQERTVATTAGAFSFLALVLTALGLYGVLAFNVGQRTRELGVRMALGATASDAVGLVIKQGLWLVLTGGAIGLAVTPLLTRLVQSRLYGVTASDPLTFALAFVVLIAVALLACWLPARRATKVDPMIALRCE